MKDFTPTVTLLLSQFDALRRKEEKLHQIETLIYDLKTRSGLLSIEPHIVYEKMEQIIRLFKP